MFVETPELPHSVRFAEKWIEWIQYKKEIKDSYKSPKSASAKAKQLAQYSEEVAIQMIEQSIANGWKGIFSIIKNGTQKEETSLRVAWAKDKPVSDYQAPGFDRSLAIAHMRKKIESFYKSDTPSPIKDWGGVYTKLLTEKCGMVVPEAITEDIKAKVYYESNKHRNRHEDQYTMRPESDIRDRELFWWLSEQKKNGNRIYLQI